MSVSSLVLLALAAVSAAGCAVGPDYVRPAVDTPAAYKEVQGWKTAVPRDETLPGPWWTIYDDARLTDLEGQVYAANQDLAAAEARVRQSRALVTVARADWYPTVAIGVSASRSRTSDNLGGGRGFAGRTTSDYAMPLTVSWDPDVWGRVRREVESNEAGAEASAADRAATQLSLQGQLAVDYFQLRALDGERRLLDETVAAFDRSLGLTRARFAQGVASGAEVALAETQLESTRAQRIDLDVQRAQLEHAIAVLVGTPAAAFALPDAPLSLEPPPVPVGVPSALLERRPDVAASERRAAAANAQIGVAQAAYYPTVTLSASGGFESSDLATWFAWPSRFWSFGPSITETVFDGGRRGGVSEQARAAWDETVAAYRQTVLAAFAEVEDQLAALRVLADEAAVQDDAVRAAEESVRLAIARYEAGTASYIDVVVAQAAALQNRLTAVELRGRRLVASALLVEALGGGWDAAAMRDGVDAAGPDVPATPAG